MKNGLKEILFLVVAFAVAAVARYAWLEPEQIGFHCLDYDAPWWCVERTALIHAIALGIFGGVSLIAGVIATLLRRRWLARFAMWVGIVGLVLYNYEFAAVGLLLGALVLTGNASRPQRGNAEQQA